MSLDPRLTPARPDLAAAHLKGRVEAARFVEGALKRIVAPIAPLRRHPAPDAPLDTEALYGERVTIYETTDEGWAWGQLQLDSYVGWLPAEALGDVRGEATNRVIALRTFVFPGPNIKLPPLMALSLGSLVTAARREGEFVVTDAGGFVPATHLAPVDFIEPDYISTARRFVGVPYLWGGRSSLGLDCSGLVQLALQAAGFVCPRDSDMQAAELGTNVPVTEALDNIERGDLVFWDGHVGIMADGLMLVHANAHHMAVTIETLPEAARRIARSGSEIAAIKRLPALSA